MGRRKAKARTTRKRVIRDWKQARAVLESWRKKLTIVRVELKRPRVIDVTPVDLLEDEPTHGGSPPVKKFHGQVIYLTRADVTLRRPSGALLVVDNYEIASITNGKTSVEAS